jgi:hypothetical protein
MSALHSVMFLDTRSVALVPLWQPWVNEFGGIIPIPSAVHFIELPPKDELYQTCLPPMRLLIAYLVGRVIYQER